MVPQFRMTVAGLVAIAVTVSTSLRGGHAAERPPLRNDAFVKPNIIIILADDMGYGDPSCYGNTAFATPHIDRLAAEGLRLTDFHACGSVCSPTRAGLLTGRYPQRAGIPGVVYADSRRNRHHGLHTREVTFAELLRELDYRTGIVGKWHLGYRRRFNPIHHGFDVFRGYVSGNVDYISHVDGTGVHDWWTGDRQTPETGYTTHLITKHAVDFIEAHRTRPFCLYVAHEAPHSPYQGPNDKPVRAIAKPRLRDGRGDIRAAYREMIREMDNGIGEILATVRRSGSAERTFVFFFSDNGATRHGSNGPLRGSKGSLWEGGHRVPAIAWWPGRIRAGTCDELATCLDLLPTMLALAGGTVPAGHKLDGVSLKRLLLDGEPLRERDVFWEYRRQAAVRHGPWKLIVDRTSPQDPRLFDLASDPGERHDRSAQRPKNVKRMTEALLAWRQNVAAGATVQPENSQLLAPR